MEIRQPGIEEFLEEHGELFEAEESKYNILFSLALRIAAKRSLRKTHRLFSFGRPGAAALQAEGRNLVLGELGPEECARLASHYSDLELPGVVAPGLVGDWFVQAAGAERFEEPVAQRIYELRERPRHPPVPGEACPADDTYLVVKWLQAFHQEADGYTPVRAELQARVEHGSFFFWSVDGEPVAMGAVVREGKRGATIGAVYTDPARRGNRFGEAVTAALAEEIFRRGKGFSNLYADLSRPAALRIYERIGYLPVCGSKAFRSCG